jgi:type II secretory pathway predicted ATPase ExeA
MERIKQALERARKQQTGSVLRPEIAMRRPEPPQISTLASADGPVDTATRAGDGFTHPYLAFYQFEVTPFVLLPDPAFFFAGTEHREVLANLPSRILGHAGATLITGEPGVGKTTLVQHLIRELGDEVSIGVINHVHPRFDNLLEWVLQAFDIEVQAHSEIRRHQAFVRFVEAQRHQGRRVLLFVDEAQNLSPSLLEELLTLMNVNVDHPTFRVVLAGQPALHDCLSRPDMHQSARCIAVTHRLRRLDEAGTEDYIRHRLQAAGGDPELFEPAACRLIHRHSQGVPRLINAHCDASLERGCERQYERIGADLVGEVLREGDGDPLRGATAGASPEPTGLGETPARPPADNDDFATRAQPAPWSAEAGRPAVAASPRQRPTNLDDAKQRLANLLEGKHPDGQG